jgi:hypothetical protein
LQVERRRAPAWPQEVKRVAIDQAEKNPVAVKPDTGKHAPGIDATESAELLQYVFTVLVADGYCTRIGLLSRFG